MEGSSMSSQVKVLEPGPVDPSVLYLQERHRTNDDELMEGIDVLNCTDHSCNLNMIPFDHPEVQEELKRAGFWHVAQIKYTQLDHALITALCDRWRPETSTFHFKVGEMTISLQDVSVLLGLNIDGLAVHHEKLNDYGPMFHELLGVWPPCNKKECTTEIKITWFRQTFSEPLSSNATEVEIQQRTRAVILHFIVCRLFADHTKGRVNLKFLPLLRDLEMCGRYSWGSAVLCMMYKELNDVALRKSNSIAGCLTLLQLWSWSHLSIGRPIVSNTDINAEHPYGCRWNGLKTWEQTPRRNVRFYRNELDLLQSDFVDWVAYGSLLDLPRICTVGHQIWTTKTPLICFDEVQMYFPDRVMRQFGYKQHIPDEPVPIKMRCQIPTCIQIWSERRMHIQTEQQPTISLDRYIWWYWQITRRFVLKTSTKSGAYIPRAPLEKDMVGLLYKVIEMAEDIKQGRVDSETGCTNLISFTKEFLENNNLSWPEEQHNAGPSQLLTIHNGPTNSQSSTTNESGMHQNLVNEPVGHPRKKPKRSTSLKQQ